ncbi:hypothetical protein [Streptomyces sp. NPDC001137]|uniref:hypothetical protein n=1 Tax=Streptomyces sp. NPDC001137 TaxID=3154378 RepID=UPI00332F697B
MSSTSEHTPGPGSAGRAPQAPGRVDLVFIEPAHRSYADFCSDLQFFLTAPIPGHATGGEEMAERLRRINGTAVCLPRRVRVWAHLYGWLAAAWQVLVRAGRRARAACWCAGMTACAMLAFYLVRTDRSVMVSLIASVVVLAVFSAGATALAADQEKVAKARLRQQAEAERPDAPADQVESGRH